MNDLDWLARNVHEWPENTPHVISAGDSAFEHGATFCEKHVCIYDRDFTNSKIIYKLQWLARRAELQNKPIWDDAPEWAEWLAQDQDGEWKWLAGLPGKYVDGWTAVKIKGHCKGLALGDWRDTLEKRPEQAEFEPFVSVEDAATAKQHDPVNNPSHYASGGIECIEAIKASMSHEAFLGYLKGNAQKYTWRYEKKVNPAEDLKKAQWYLSKLIDEQFS